MGAITRGEFLGFGAERHIADTLIARRDAIGRAWLTDVNPIVDPSLDRSGTLQFVNAAVAAGVAQAPASYEVAWFSFDNATGASTPVGEVTTVAAERAPAPAPLPAARGSFLRVAIRAIDRRYPSWSVPVQAYFTRVGQGWTLVGFERLPDDERRR